MARWLRDDARGLCLALLMGSFLFTLGHAQTCPGDDPGQGPTSSLRDETAPKTIFAELDSTELIAVRDYLLGIKELNLSPYPDASASSNIIFSIEMLPPPKADALAYLDAYGPLPARRAKAILFLLNTTSPHVMQVEVGPLPNCTYYKEYKYAHQPQQIHIHSRPATGFEYNRMEELIDAAMTKLDPIMQQELGGFYYNNCTDKCIWWTDGAPRGWTNTIRKTWIWFMRLVDGTYLHPVGLEMYIDTTGTDPSQWNIEKIYFSKVLFNNADEMVQYYNKYHKFPITVHTPNATEMLYSAFGVPDVSKGRPANKRRGPMSYEPFGKRFTITRNHINYMGWDMDVGVRTSAGIRFFNVMFKGQRIIYELAVQTAMASYGGSSPTQAQTNYLDNAWGMGFAHHELVQGVDCPYTAAFMDVTHMWDTEGPVTIPNALCVFEHDMGVPLRRHYDKDFMGSYRFYAGVKTYALVVRGISTIFNYDYVYDLVFYADGTVEQKVIFFGYPQGARYDVTGDLKYGYPLWIDEGGSIHDHMLHFKVDLDVLGTSNSLLVESMKYETYSMKDIDPALPVGYRKWVDRTIIPNESGSKFVLNPAVPAQFVVVNENQKNKWGSMRGYRVDLSHYIHQLYPDDAPWLRGVQWSKYQIAATKYKDDEPVSATIFEQASPMNPVVDFASLFDGDDIQNQDLVLWLTTGKFHLPVSEDAPNSPSSAGAIGFVLRPYNYFDEDSAKDLLESVLIKKDDQGNNVRADYGLPTDETGGCRPEFPEVVWNGTYIEPTGGLTS